MANDSVMRPKIYGHSMTLHISKYEYTCTHSIFDFDAF